MPVTFADNLHALVEEITLLPDPQERLTFLIDRSKCRTELRESARVEENRVYGCVSAVWLVGSLDDGVCRFQSDADSPMVKGLAALYQDLYDNLPPEEVLKATNTLMQDIGLADRLSGTRLNGLAAMDARFKQLALKYASGTITE